MRVEGAKFLFLCKALFQPRLLIKESIGYIYLCCLTRSGGRSTVSSGRSSGSVPSDSCSLDITLAEGMSVFVNKEMGLVKFIGTTEFAEGVWLGVELRKPGKIIIRYCIL